MACTSPSLGQDTLIPTSTLPLPTLTSETTADTTLLPQVSQIPSPVAAPAKVGMARISIVYDNTAYDPRLKAKWGFVALVEYDGHILLFDTGGNGPTLLKNMELMGVNPQSVEAILLSHEHGDHTDGLHHLLIKGIKPTVFVPEGFTTSFKDNVAAQTELVEVDGPLEIFPGVHSTGQLGTSIHEQALVLETSVGTVVVTGCAHPGVVNMVGRAKEIFFGEISLVVGGFHLRNASTLSIKRIIEQFRELGVQQVTPTHCTGEKAIRLFAEAYGENYLQGGVGQIIVIGSDH